jgi:DNA-binding FadR family transcriptional regulator
LKKKFAEKMPDLYRIINSHESKEIAVELTCHELIRAGNRFDLRYHQRYNQIVESAANLWVKKLLNTLEEQTKSSAEMTRIIREEDKRKEVMNLLNQHKHITDEVVEKYREIK